MDRSSSTSSTKILALLGATIALQAQQNYSSSSRRSGAARLHRRVVRINNSPMSHMLQTGDDMTFRFLFRMRKRYFIKLLQVYKRIFVRTHLKTFTFVKRVRKRQISAKLSLALTLRYLCTSTEGTDCAYLYGLLPSRYSVYMRHGLRCLDECLDAFPESTYEIPVWRTLRTYADVITEKEEGLVKDVWGAVDGVCLRFEKSGDFIIEGQHYSGYKCADVKKLVCIFAPDGSVCGAVWGVGTMHDSTAFKQLEVKLELQFREQAQQTQGLRRLRIVGDSAFANTALLVQATDRYLKDVELLKAHRRVRNYSEIGIGSLSRCFRRLNNKLPSDDEELVDIIIGTVLKMNNFRVRVARSGQLLRMHRDFMYTDSDIEEMEESDETGGSGDDIGESDDDMEDVALDEESD